jgi:hypothetical protein
MKCAFDDIYFSPHNLSVYHPPKKTKGDRGFDTEVWTTTGNIRLITSSDDEHNQLWNPNLDEILAWLVYKPYRDTCNFFYNIDYDVSSILKMLPRALLEEIKTTTTTVYGIYKLRYIPRKLFTITIGKNVVSYFDIAQFYACRLEKAASKTLGEHKIAVDIATLDTLPDDELFRYCHQDSVLAQRLAARSRADFRELGIFTNKPLSCAYMSKQYLRAHCATPYIDNYVAMKFAHENIAGGFFQIVQRGGFPEIHVADIGQAYPAIMAGMLDLNQGEWVESRHECDPYATYSFTRCRVFSRSNRGYIPRWSNDNAHVRVYPAGDLGICTLTKDQFDTIKNDSDYDITALASMNWYPTAKEYPYRGAILELKALRERYKADKDTREKAVKVVMNSMYGIKAEITKRWEKTGPNEEDWKSYWKAGSMNNFIEAALITSGVRTQIYKCTDNDAVIGAATDSIFSTKKLSLDYGNGLGEWDYLGEAPGVMVMNGFYSIKGPNIRKGLVEHMRGFKSDYDDDNEPVETLVPLLQKYPDATLVPRTTHRPIRIGEALNCSDPDSVRSVEYIGYFTDFDKDININGDVKRLWERPFRNCADVLSNNMRSDIIVF